MASKLKEIYGDKVSEEDDLRFYLDHPEEVDDEELYDLIEMELAERFN